MSASYSSSSTHQWSNGPLVQCINCGVFQATPMGSRKPCDSEKLSGETEPCCDCGEESPVGDLIGGSIFCRECREKPINRIRKGK